jgi:cephalosporin-C deacetylase-like acetyl esterase
MKLFMEKSVAAEMLAMEMILLKLHWWPVRNYEPPKDFEDMWKKHLKDKLIINRDYDNRSNINIQTYWAKITFKSSWHTTFSVPSKILKFIFITSPLS